MRGPNPRKPKSCPAAARVDPYAARRASPSTACQRPTRAEFWRSPDHLAAMAATAHPHSCDLLRPVHVLDHRSQRTPPPSACAAEAGGCWLLSSADQSALQLTVQPARRDAAAGEEMVSVQSPGGPGTRPSREADEHRVHSHHREGQQRPAERGERWQPTPPAADDASAAQHQREEHHR